MLRNLLILLCTAGTMQVSAQYSTRAKITKKPDDAQIDYKQVGAPMPTLRLFLYHDSLDMAGTGNDVTNKKKKKSSESDFRSKVLLTNEDVDNGANLFVMIFNPTCSHCEDETRLLEKNLSLFKKSKLLLMATPVMQPYLKDFANTMKLRDYPEITLGVDSSGFLNQVFLYQALPQITIYGADRKLLRIYSGEVSIDTLEQFIQ